MEINQRERRGEERVVGWGCCLNQIEEKNPLELNLERSERKKTIKGAWDV